MEELIRIFEEKQADGKKRLRIRGYATVEFDDNGQKVIDSHGTIITSASTRESISEAMKIYEKRGAPILFNHNPDRGIGKVETWSVDEKGVFIDGVIAEPITDEERSIYEKIKEGIYKGLSIRFADVEVDFEKINGEKVPVLTVRTIMEISVTPVPSNSYTTFEAYMRSLRAKWTTKYINNLPDAAFAYIAPGGKKDEEGKTVPRSLRYLPHHNENVTNSNDNKTVDLPHLRNALARLPQTKLPAEAKAKAKAHLIKHAKALGVGDYAEKSEIKEDFEMNEELMRKIEELEKFKKEFEEKERKMKEEQELQAKIDEAVRQHKEEKEKLEKEIEELRAKLEEPTARMSKEPGEGTTGAGQTRTLVDEIKFLDTRDYEELEAEYLIKQVLSGKEKFDYCKRDVYKYHAEKAGISWDEEEFKRAISTSTGVMKEPSLEAQPIEMDGLLTPLPRIVPHVRRDSKTHEWYQKTGRSRAVFAAEGFTPTPGDSVYTKKSATMKIAYAAGKVNDFAENLGAISNMAIEIKAKNTDMDIQENWALINADSEVESEAYNGLLKYISANSRLFLDSGTSSFTLDAFEDGLAKYKNNLKKSSVENKRPTHILVDTKLYSAIRKLMLAKFSGRSQTATITVGGIAYRALVFDNIPIVEMDGLRDYESGAPTVALSAITGALSDANYYVRVAAVTEDGETEASTEANQATSSQGLRVTITARADDLYYRIYIATSTGAEVLAKVVKNTVGTGSLNVDFTADSDIGSLVLKPLNTDQARVIYVKIGGDDGLEVGVNEYKTFVKLAKTGDFESFYIKSYLFGVLKNEKAVLAQSVKL